MLLAMLGWAPAHAAGSLGATPADLVATRILADRCSAATTAANDGTVDPICHRTLAPGDSRRSVQRAERDRGLLAAYRDVETLVAMRDRQIADVDAEIELAQRRMTTLHRELEILRRQAQAAEAPQAEALMERARSRARAILSDEELVRARRAEQVRIHERFDRDGRRLRLLLSALSVGPKAPLDALETGSAGSDTTAAAVGVADSGPGGPLARR